MQASYNPAHSYMLNHTCNYSNEQFRRASQSLTIAYIWNFQVFALPLLWKQQYHAAHNGKASTQGNCEWTASKRKCSPLTRQENTAQWTELTVCSIKPLTSPEGQEGTFLKDPSWRTLLPRSIPKAENQPPASGDPGKILSEQLQQTQT